MTARTRVASALGLVLIVLLGYWSVSQLGYVPRLTGEDCAAVGYDPVPSFERLVDEYGESPYCARVIRGENWF